MAAEPRPHVRAAAALRTAGAALVAGHSAHVFHCVSNSVLHDLGDFIDDDATDPELRNDLGLLFLVTVESGRPDRLEAVPLSLDYCHTRLAEPAEREWVRRRFRRACAAPGSDVVVRGDRLIVGLCPTADA